MRDGVTMAVPLYALNQLPRERCEWLVPGMLKEKVHLLLKSLPQKLRRHCVPLPDYAAKFCERVNEAGTFGRGDLIDAIIADIRAQITISVLTTDFKPEPSGFSPRETSVVWNCTVQKRSKPSTCSIHNSAGAMVWKLVVM